MNNGFCQIWIHKALDNNSLSSPSSTVIVPEQYQNSRYQNSARTNKETSPKWRVLHRPNETD